MRSLVFSFFVVLTCFSKANSQTLRQQFQQKFGISEVLIAQGLSYEAYNQALSELLAHSEDVFDGIQLSDGTKIDRITFHDRAEYTVFIHDQSFYGDAKDWYLVLELPIGSTSLESLTQITNELHQSGKLSELMIFKFKMTLTKYLGISGFATHDELVSWEKAREVLALLYEIDLEMFKNFRHQGEAITDVHVRNFAPENRVMITTTPGEENVDLSIHEDATLEDILNFLKN